MAPSVSDRMDDAGCPRDPLVVTLNLERKLKSLTKRAEQLAFQDLWR